jgi:putative thiamine transport system ATP-binding protein
MPSDTPLGLRLCDVTITLAGRPLIALSINVPPGQIVTVMGPSGCGKSTLLNYLCGTLDPAFAAHGRVYLNQRRIDHLLPEERRIGILFQDDLLFPHLSVAGNLAFGLSAAWRSRAERRKCIEAALAEAGLEGLADQDPARLSGGQRARVSLLRVLLSQPDALLLDEPFAKLDPALRQRFRLSVFELIERARLPTIMVTHDKADADAADGPIVDVTEPADSDAGSHSQLPPN